MKLVVTIDTEEDNWGDYSPNGYTLENITYIPELQDLFDEYSVLPTYLITYSVATDPRAVMILRRILDQSRCEIGAHCHPWNTPPFEGVSNEKNSMLCNLSADLQFRKIQRLHETIVKNVDTVPLSFRTGRWGYGKDVARSLHKLGYKVDSSILSLVDWSDYHGPDFSRVFSDPFRFQPEFIYEPNGTGVLLEVPASVGFLHANFDLCNHFYNQIRSSNLRWLRLIGILDKLALFNKVGLTPEQFSASNMIALTKTFMKRGSPIINLFFHSTSLCAGLTPSVQTEADRREFMSRIREFLKFTRQVGIESIRLSDSLKLYPPC